MGRKTTLFSSECVWFKQLSKRLNPGNKLPYLSCPAVHSNTWQSLSPKKKGQGHRDRCFSATTEQSSALVFINNQMSVLLQSSTAAGRRSAQRMSGQDQKASISSLSTTPETGDPPPVPSQHHTAIVQSWECPFVLQPQSYTLRASVCPVCRSSVHPAFIPHVCFREQMPFFPSTFLSKMWSCKGIKHIKEFMCNRTSNSNPNALE